MKKCGASHRSTIKPKAESPVGVTPLKNEGKEEETFDRRGKDTPFPGGTEEKAW